MPALEIGIREGHAVKCGGHYHWHFTMQKHHTDGTVQEVEANVYKEYMN